ncbi:MAG: DUF4870 family protein [Acidiferrobacter sp.]
MSQVRGFNGNKERELVVVAYALYAVGLFGLMLPSVLALVLNYQRRNRSGSCYGSHHRWMIRTFWWGMFWGVVGLLLFFVLVGYAVFVGLTVWWVYRVIRGALALADEEPMPPSALQMTKIVS